jgi:ribosomal protein L29
MRKLTKDYSAKKITELEKDIHTIRQEIAKLILDRKSNPQKDTNSIVKKRKQLAVMLTVLVQKKHAQS